MKIFRICPELPHIKEYIKKLPSEQFVNFQTLTDNYRNHNMLLPGGWKHAVESRGHEVFECIYADYTSQLIWKKENPSRIHKGSAPAWNLDEILLEQLISFQPDVVVLYTGVLYRISSPLRKRILDALPNLKQMVCVWGDEIPHGYSPSAFFYGVDLLFACTEGYNNDFKGLGLKTFLLPSAFDAFIDYKRPAKKDIDISFIGNTGYLESDHLQRYLFLKDIFGKRKILFWGKEKKQTKLNALLNVAFVLSPLLILLPSILYRLLHKASAKFSHRLSDVVSTFGSLKQYQLGNRTLRLLLDQMMPFQRPLSKMYRGNYRGIILSGQDYLSVLARSKIVINYHRDEGNDFGNIRCFEATGVGACLLTNSTEKMQNLFSDDEIVGFTSTEDCIRKIDQLLADSDYREAIALKGRQRTIREHTLDSRISYMLQVIETEAGETTVRAKRTGADNYLKIYYDLRKRPVSYDFMFFLQSCYLRLAKLNSNSRLLVVVLIPQNTSNYSALYGWTYEEMRLRSKRILGQLLDRFPTFDSLFIEISDSDTTDVIGRITHPNVPELLELDLQPHHREFYKDVNAQPYKIMPIKASSQALEQVKFFLQKSQIHDFITITIRNSKQSPERNNDFNALREFIDYALKKKKIAVVIVPDTDFRSPVEDDYPEFVYKQPSLDFDLRLALYETASLNYFVNNGPCIAAQLDQNIKSVMFKLVVPSVPHCTVEFIESQGYKYNQTPAYCVDSKWVWSDDSLKNLKAELDAIF